MWMERRMQEGGSLMIEVGVEEWGFGVWSGWEMGISLGQSLGMRPLRRSLGLGQSETSL